MGFRHRFQGSDETYEQLNTTFYGIRFERWNSRLTWFERAVGYLEEDQDSLRLWVTDGTLTWSLLWRLVTYFIHFWSLMQKKK